MLSFHATKVFNTFEGGALVCPDAEDEAAHRLPQELRLFGEVTVVAPGINGKMNEVQAAFGLLQLKHSTRRSPGGKPSMPPTARRSPRCRDSLPPRARRDGQQLRLLPDLRG